MAAYWLNQELVFPPPEQATEEGLIAIGGDASPERLLLAYSQGIFPWPQPELPLLWFSPDPRFVLPLDHVRLSRTLRKDLAKHPYEIRTDSAFEAVIKHCASAPRKNQDGTWITDELIEGYLALFRKGFAHSIEAWRDGKLVGGLYGVSLGKSFSGRFDVCP